MFSSWNAAAALLSGDEAFTVQIAAASLADEGSQAVMISTKQLES